MAETKPDRGAHIRDALAQGNRARALTLLMERFGDDVYRYCRRMLGARDLADDVHQRVFIEAHRDLDRLRTQDGPRSWLLRIAHHRCLDELRWHRRWRRRFIATPHLPDSPSPAARPDELVARRSFAAALDSALARLRPRERTATLLRYQEGLTYEEMAEVCGEKPATLQARVARAMIRLRAHLLRMGVTPDDV